MNDECVYWYQVATYLRDLLLALGLTEQESAAGESALDDYFRDRNRLVSEVGPENAALAALALDFALHQTAASHSHVPRQDNVMAQLGQARQRISNLHLLVELHELARASDLDAFRSLIENPSVRQIIPVQGEEHLALLFEQAREVDFSGAIEGLAVHTALTESLGPDRYWTEVYVQHARKLLAIEAFRTTMAEPHTGWSGFEEWLDFRENTWSGTAISLTDTARDTFNLQNVRSYMDEILALERDLLEQETPP